MNNEPEKAHPDIRIDQTRLEALCHYWQQVLRLQDWEVKVKLTRPWEMHHGSALGECLVNEHRQSARINIRHAQDDDPNDPDCIEDTLVHELLHIHTKALRVLAGDKDTVAEEQAINAIAGALVRLNRKPAA